MCSRPAQRRTKFSRKKNADGSYTVFFSTLEEMMGAVVQISKTENKKVSVFNIHGHGLPGAMWFPKDQDALADWSCADWKSAANGADEDNYNQYYGAVSVDEIQQIRDISNNSSVNMGCTVGLNEWQDEVTKHPEFKAAFSEEAQMHFLSCVVGLGTVGEAFVKGMAQLMIAGAGHVEASMDFGLGDWSMPAGMGFWDYQSDDQVNRDNQNYGLHKRDAEIAQKGTIRLASAEHGSWATSQWQNRDVMSLAFETTFAGTMTKDTELFTSIIAPAPARVRIPGTSVYTPVTAK